MRVNFILISLLILGSAFAKIEREEGVYVVTDSNIDELKSIAQREGAVIVIEFYAPWCGHCKSLAPEYAQAAQTVEREGDKIILAKVDATKETAIAGQYGVNGYPTLYTMSAAGNFEKQEYQGGRTADTILEYMRKLVPRDPDTFETVEELEALRAKSPHHLVVGVFKEESADFKAVALENLDLRFAHTSNKDISKHYGLDETKDQVFIAYHSALLSKKDSKIKAKEVGSLQTFIDSHYTLVADVMIAQTEKHFKKNNQPIVTLLVDQLDLKNQPKNVVYFRNRFKKFAKDHDDYHFALANKEKFPQVAEKLGMGADKAVLFVEKGAQFYKFTGELMKDGVMQPKNIAAFIQDFADGNVEVYIKSKPIPEEAYEEDVRVAVGKNFEEIVNSDTKDTLIEFYAPWCGHCKTLAPIYSKLAGAVKDYKNLQIVKMDATDNDAPPQFQVQGFPTLFFVPKGQYNNPKKYEGEREYDNFIQYLEKESEAYQQGPDKSGDKNDDDL